ncbi:acetate--CoA ligase [Sulfurimonas autotrophica]|uniref:acetate--CoA ligase n=1 Tax=Sulfurimonas autotrophica (strain ATCC BAA-671 / DSM 16294 / JCM 11897 / OK10) TaxID=563040 RepID=E0UPL3_SULAO|nr:acetate--CoA ligase [Sulfurimonas autotrophica]ADN08605.1 AMP-dependent synthetase and ligase [Sulfurimonas autotrophica DSM 16294]
MQNNWIVKKKSDFLVEPNLLDYEKVYNSFKWEDVAKEFDGLPSGGLNIAHEAIDRHADSDKADKVALLWLGEKGQKVSYTYMQMKKETAKFANVLKSLGIKKGERIYTLSPRLPELYIGAIGILKNLSVMCPLFSQFGPGPILQRMQSGDATALLTTQKLFNKKIRPMLNELKGLKYILLIDAEEDENEIIRSLPKLMQEASDEFEIPPTDPEDMSLLHFTSGTTGMPKGVVHVHKAIYTHWMTGKYVLDFHEHDNYWCTADPGWVTGTSYGIITPWVHGVTNIVDESEFNANRWYEILQNEKVSVFYTAPTAIRRLMRIDNEPTEEYDLSHLRLIQSVGEPLNPEAVIWGVEKLKMAIHDNWWQTETGGIMIANLISQTVRPGSMGRPLPGITAAIVRQNGDGTVTEVTEPGKDGDLALRPGWPSMFRAYLHNEEKYKKSFVGGWYISGDLAYKDEDGYYWFVGRADDIIKTSGHMVGPFEVESALMEHPAVAEAGVIGKPDELIGQLVKAFVSLKHGYEPTEELKRELIGFARKKLGAAVAPKEIEFQEKLPKTRSGKIMRRLLKAREMGLPEGDTSTLEE